MALLNSRSEDPTDSIYSSRNTESRPPRQPISRESSHQSGVCPLPPDCRLGRQPTWKHAHFPTHALQNAGPICSCRILWDEGSGTVPNRAEQLCCSRVLWEVCFMAWVPSLTLAPFPSLSKNHLSVHIEYVGPDRPTRLLDEARYGKVRSRNRCISVVLPPECSECTRRKFVICSLAYQGV